MATDKLADGTSVWTDEWCQAAVPVGNDSWICVSDARGEDKSTLSGQQPRDGGVKLFEVREWPVLVEAEAEAEAEQLMQGIVVDGVTRTEATRSRLSGASEVSVTCCCC